MLGISRGRRWGLRLGPGMRASEKAPVGGRGGGEAERDMWRPERLGTTEVERELALEWRAAPFVRHACSKGWAS